MFKIDFKEPIEKYFEDFIEGQEMPVVVKGPMQVGHQVRWAGACDNYGSEFHHDATVAKEVGLPGVLLSGPFMASYMLTEVTHWLGCKARVVSFSDRNSGTTMPNDVAHIGASVKRKWIEEDKGWVEVDCQITNQDGKITTPGSVVAKLPLRERSAV